MSSNDWKPHKINELEFVGRGKSRHRPRIAPELYGVSDTKCHAPVRYFTNRLSLLGFRLALSPSRETGVKGAKPAGVGTEGAKAERPPELP